MSDSHKRTVRRSSNSPATTKDANEGKGVDIPRTSSASRGNHAGTARTQANQQEKKPNRASMEVRLPSQAVQDEWNLPSTSAVTVARHSDEQARKGEGEERTVVLRAYSERPGHRRGHRRSFRLEAGAPTAGHAPSSARSVSAAGATVFDRGSLLRQQLAVQIVGHDKVIVDLSHRWDTLDSEAGARSKLIHGLLVAGNHKLIRIDLSNHRVADLCGWADVRQRRG